MLKKFGVLVLVSALAGCATSGPNFRPVVDLKGQDPAVYDQNLRECQQYALQVSGAADRAVAGAVAGALLGVAFAAIGGGSRNVGAGIGGLSGATSGAVAGENSQRSIISRCLAGRGFSVLN
jgi:outer membrane lipoprotein SlyB